LNFRNISPVNIIMTPIKQHLGCCVVAPLLLKLAGASVLAGLIVKNETAEFIFLALVLPPAVWGILKLEDYWRTRHEKNHDAHHDHCDTHCKPASSFKKRYALNLVIAFSMAFVLHLLFHHHH
jgi:hypothetical protein